MNFVILLLICLHSVGYSTKDIYTPLQCPAKNPRYWYLAAELTIGLDYNIVPTIDECYMINTYINKDATATLRGYGIEINITIKDTDQKFVGAVEGVTKDNKVSVLLFTTQRLDTIQHNISLTITCLEYNCGTVKYKDELSEAIKHITECDITINGSCIKCVNVYMDPIYNTDFFFPKDKFVTYNTNYDKRGSYGVTFENQDPLKDCFIKLDNISYEICKDEK
ncbi:NFkB inhibitor [NY_014 poxvirus]|uniref:NFkB inhibitor n=1 Tax=NY_014 poxvirus TaxID=2025360 RepID=UPI000B99FB8E|nr:NFkB inhibitor [NY_014 poxvirus]AST09586.1 NFkB inhibitor [NY_014 poxvirus]